MSKFSSVADGATFLNKIGDAKEAMKFVNRMDSLPNGNTVLQKLQYSTGDTTNEVVRFFNGLDDDVLEKGTIVFNKFDSPDEFTNVIRQTKKTYYEGTTKVDNVPRDISRTVYQRNDINWNLIDSDTGLTNKELAKGGFSPIGSDGKKIELHHFTQEEPGVIIEILYSKHKEYYDSLHGLIPDGESFRNNDILNKQYNNFRKQYWIWRASKL